MVHLNIHTYIHMIYLYLKSSIFNYVHFKNTSKRNQLKRPSTAKKQPTNQFRDSGQLQNVTRTAFFQNLVAISSMHFIIIKKCLSISNGLSISWVTNMHPSFRTTVVIPHRRMHTLLNCPFNVIVVHETVYHFHIREYEICHTFPPHSVHDFWNEQKTVFFLYYSFFFFSISKWQQQQWDRIAA